MSALPEQVRELFTAQEKTIAVAESCTGGLLGAELTSVSGSSAYFLGGVISYANAVKQAELGVTKETLLSDGAVSEEAAKQMAQGVREKLGADIGVSITGVAGPEGGTPLKPVGTTWIGLSDERGTRAYNFTWAFDRKENRRLSVEAALKLLVSWAERHSAAG